MHQQLPSPAPRFPLGMQIALALARAFSMPDQTRPGQAKPAGSRVGLMASLSWPDDVCRRATLCGCAKQAANSCRFNRLTRFIQLQLETMNERRAQRSSAAAQQQLPRKCCGCDTNAAPDHNKTENTEVGVLLQLNDRLEATL